MRDIAIAPLPDRRRIRADASGIIIADTKFEFGLDDDGTLTLMDEVLTPDSSRFWPVEGYDAPARVAIRRATTSSSCATGWKR